MSMLICHSYDSVSFCDRRDFIGVIKVPNQLTLNYLKGRLSLVRRKKWQPNPVILPGESHGQRSLTGYSSWGHKESDTTERLNHHQGN